MDNFIGNIKTILSIKSNVKLLVFVFSIIICYIYCIKKSLNFIFNDFFVLKHLKNIVIKGGDYLCKKTKWF